jgi:chitin disaccharide deacetylase
LKCPLVIQEQKRGRAMIQMIWRMYLVVGLLAWAAAQAGYAEDTIELVVRGDDMGYSHDTNLSIIKAYKEGILTSASVHVPCQYSDEAFALCKANPGLAAGIHVTLWDSIPERPILPYEEIPSLATPYGFFYLSRADFDRAHPKLEDVEKEVRAQIAKARACGLHFVYLDCHNMGTQKGLRPDIRELFIRIAKEQRLLISTHEGEIRMGIGPIRWSHPAVWNTFPQLVEQSEFIEQQRDLFFEKLSTMKPGLYLLVTHPGLYPPAHAREMNEIILSPKTREIIRDRKIRLVSYQELWNRKFGKR